VEDVEDEQTRAQREFMELVEETHVEKEYVSVKRRRVKEMEERAVRLGKGGASATNETEEKKGEEALEEEVAPATGVSQVNHGRASVLMFFTLVFGTTIFQVRKQLMDMPVTIVCSFCGFRRRGKAFW